MMEKVTKSMINEFLSQPWFAFVGATNNPKKFGNSAYKELKKKNVRLIPVNPNYKMIDGDVCYPSISDLPEKPVAVISMVPKATTLQIAKEAHQAGVRQIWIQQQSETEESVFFCRQNNINGIYGECILMHTFPVKSVHGVHRWFRKLFGRMPR